MSYPQDQLHQEVAYIAFHLHWSLESIMSMEHQERRNWVGEAARIVQTMNQSERS